MKNPKTIPEAIDAIEKYLKYYFERLGWKDIPIKQEGEYLSDDPDSDSSDLRLNVNGWILISAFETEELLPCLWGKRTIPAIHYNIYKEVLIRSVHRDDPDEWDVVEIALDVRGLSLVIEQVIHTMIDNDLEGIGEQLEMDEMAQEQEEFSKQEGI